VIPSLLHLAQPLANPQQRFRNYATQDASTLNADQRSAIAALPALEAVSKELDEVMKAMEEVELVAAAKAREEREAAARDADASAADRLKDHGVQVAAHVMGFMGLHSLLHPSRPSDHTNLTFAPLTLPLRLQEEVLATDILRVARMHDELAAGGDSAHAVLQVLAEGSTGADEESE
jgi:23S rRNA pseudoU1915 N3-methylase RlmH